MVVGSTTDWLLHSSPVPVAISPRGYRGARSGRLIRDHLCVSGTPESVKVVERVAALTDQLDVKMRVVTFAIRGRTMFPPEVGLHAEDSILSAWAQQLRETLAKLKADGVVGDDVDLQVVTGNGWDEALDDAEWDDGELLALGTSSRRSLKRLPRLTRRQDHPAQPGAGLGAAQLGSVLRGAAVDGDLTARDRRRPVTGQPGDHV